MGAITRCFILNPVCRYRVGSTGAVELRLISPIPRSRCLSAPQEASIAPPVFLMPDGAPARAPLLPQARTLRQPVKSRSGGNSSTNGGGLRGRVAGACACGAGQADSAGKLSRRSDFGPLPAKAPLRPSVFLIWIKNIRLPRNKIGLFRDLAFAIEQ